MQPTVDTMLKDSETSRYATRRTHRTYTRQFKAEMVAACQVPGASIAAIAGAHAMNANVLHRWLKEHARSSCHQITLRDPAGAAPTSTPTPAFLPVQLPRQLPVQATQQTPPVIRIELRRGATTMEMTWPITAAPDCAAWMRQLLR